MPSHPADSWTPLHYAAHHGHPDVVSYLLSVGADRDIQTIHGKIAAELTNDSLIKGLLGVEGSAAELGGSGGEGESSIDVFLSCDSSDLELAKRIQADINKAGFSSFLSCPDLDGAEAFAKFNQQLKAASVVLALLSNEYAEDPECRKQVNFADGAKKVLITLLTKKGTTFPPAGPMSPVMAGTLYQVR